MFHGTHIQVLNIAKCNAVPVVGVLLPQVLISAGNCSIYVFVVFQKIYVEARFSSEPLLHF